MPSDGSTGERNASTSTTQAAKSRFKACTQPITQSPSANEAASAFLEKSTEAIDKGADLLRTGAATGGGILQKGAESGIRAIEGLLPR